MFVLSGTTWTQRQKLVATDGAASDWFGRAVALSGDTALVGAIFADVAGHVDQGAAYVFTGLCGRALSATTADASAAGGSGTVDVTAWDSACGFTAASNTAWISVTAGATWTGSGTVTYNVGPNRAPRAPGTLTVAEQTFTVTQANGCTYGLTASSVAIVAAGGTATVGVTASDAACAWSRASNVAWITIAQGTSGAGAATLTYTVAPNLGLERTGTLTLAGQTFTVNQAGGCTFTLATNAALGELARRVPLRRAPRQRRGVPVDRQQQRAVGRRDQCAERRRQFDPLTLAVEPNTGAARTGTLTAAGRTIDDRPRPRRAARSAWRRAVNAGASGAAGTLAITAGHAGCAWTGRPAPLDHVPDGRRPGPGPGSLAFVRSPRTSRPRSARGASASAGSPCP